MCARRVARDRQFSASQPGQPTERHCAKLAMKARRAWLAGDAAILRRCCELWGEAAWLTTMLWSNLTVSDGG